MASNQDRPTLPSIQTLFGLSHRGQQFNHPSSSHSSSPASNGYSKSLDRLAAILDNGHESSRSSLSSHTHLPPVTTRHSPPNPYHSPPPRQENASTPPKQRYLDDDHMPPPRKATRHSTSYPATAAITVPPYTPRPDIAEPYSFSVLKPVGPHGHLAVASTSLSSGYLDPIRAPGYVYSNDPTVPLHSAPPSLRAYPTTDDASSLLIQSPRPKSGPGSRSVKHQAPAPSPQDEPTTSTKRLRKGHTWKHVIPGIDGKLSVERSGETTLPWKIDMSHNTGQAQHDVGSHTSQINMRPNAIARNLAAALNGSSINNPAAKYECEWCQKKFNRPSSLKIHVNTHTGDKPYPCTFPGCGRRFSVLSNMRRHSRVHAQSRHYDKKSSRNHGNSDEAAEEEADVEDEEQEEDDINAAEGSAWKNPRDGRRIHPPNGNYSSPPITAQHGPSSVGSVSTMDSPVSPISSRSVSYDSEYDTLYAGTHPADLPYDLPSPIYTSSDSDSDGGLGTRMDLQRIAIPIAHPMTNHLSRAPQSRDYPHQNSNVPQQETSPFVKIEYGSVAPLMLSQRPRAVANESGFTQSAPHPSQRPLSRSNADYRSSFRVEERSAHPPIRRMDGGPRGVPGDQDAAMTLLNVSRGERNG